MKFSLALTALASAAVVAASPLRTNNPFKRMNDTAPTDTQVLQYALTLENLEAKFYADAVAKFSEQDFVDAGYPAWVYGRISQVAKHEQTHVNLLAAALGDSAVKACEYAFPYTDVKSFLVFACGLENIGVSAYIGAAQYITDAQYLTIAGTILSVEARHQSFINAPVLGGQPWTGPFDTPLGLNMVYTLAAQLITSCPDSNAMLPVMASKPLTAMMSPIFDASAGQTVQLSWDGVDSASGTVNAAFYNGLGSAIVPVNGGSVTVPEGIQGYSYVIVTSASDVASVSADNIIAGPAEVQTAFSSSDSNPGFMNPYNA